jgi:hypothetical protein
MTLLLLLPLFTHFLSYGFNLPRTIFAAITYTNHPPNRFAPPANAPTSLGLYSDASYE